MPKKSKGNTIKILVELSEDENKKVEVYRALYNLQTKVDAIKQMVEEAKVPKPLKNWF